MWKPRLLALDLDGTLVDPGDSIPNEIKAAVADAVAIGTHIVISTGRGWAATQYHVEALGLPPGMHVVSNGAVVVSYPPLRIEESTTFDTRSLIERIIKDHPHLSFAVEVVGRGYLVSPHFPRGELSGTIEVVPVDHLGAQRVNRLIVRDARATADDFIVLAQSLGLSGVSYAIGHSAWLDIAPQGVNKAQGLEHVVARLGIDRRDVLALGDGRNDIEMLSWAGRGVALGDAPDEVKQCAAHVTGYFDEGGTVQELRRWF